MIKKIYMICFLLLFSVTAIAQDFEIVSVECLPFDATAIEEKLIGTNGRECAVIRVATQNLAPEQRENFNFVPDMGSRVEQRAERDGEIWLWVSPGMQHLRFKGGKLGQLELHFLDWGVNIQSLKTYKIVIRGTGKDDNPALTQQYLVFQITPANAMLEVNGDLWEVGANGVAKNFVNFGTYSYRVQAPNYHPETNTVTVDDPDNAETVIVNLKPDFVEVTLQVDADAEIWINNEKKGTRTWKGPLGKGTYKIECKQAYHETTVISKEITADMNGQTITLAPPKPIYGSLNIESTPDFATIYIDGKEMGKTPKSIPQILIGQHELKLTKEGYADYIETIRIKKGEQNTIKAGLFFAERKQGEDLIFSVSGMNFTMKKVDGGTFQMGGNVSKDTRPIHSVTLSNFYIGECEVTQALWNAVMGSNPSYFKDYNLPVEFVSYNDIVDVFLPKLNQLTGKNFRLPTEAEWEYAARGGNKSKGYKYAGSDNVDDVSWYWKNSGDNYLSDKSWGQKCIEENNSRTHAVMMKQANELGLYDMSGNVSEWCSDWYGEYSNESQINPKHAATLSDRVLRGGSWSCNTWENEVSSRWRDNPNSKQAEYGFRLALSGTDNDYKENSQKQRLLSDIPEGAIGGKFSVAKGKQVFFSQGNLQYQASTNTWRFAEHQYDYIGGIVPERFYNGANSLWPGNVYGSNNRDISPHYTGWIDLFGWGTSGYHDSQDPDNVNYQPWSTEWTASQNWSSSQNSLGYGPSINMASPNLTGSSANYDWGVYNPISNGGNKPGIWRTLTEAEWSYLFFSRTTTSGIRYAVAQVNNVNGIILLPDNWEKSYYSINNTNQKNKDFESNVISSIDWVDNLQAYGAVFLPQAGYRVKTDYHAGLKYWSASVHSLIDISAYAANCIEWPDDSSFRCKTDSNSWRCDGLSVRLVCPVKN